MLSWLCVLAKPLGTHAKASLPLYERSVGFASCKAFGRSFQASLPCLLLPLHRTSLFPQPLQKDNNPSPHTQPSQNRIIPFAFRRVSVCVCLVGFASIAIVVVCGRCVLHRLFATTCKHPCLNPLGTHAKASLPLYERSVGFASCKAFGRSFQASLPCLLLPLHRTSLFPQPL